MRNDKIADPRTFLLADPMGHIGGCDNNAAPSALSIAAIDSPQRQPPGARRQLDPDQRYAYLGNGFFKYPFVQSFGL